MFFCLPVATALPGEKTLDAAKKEVQGRWEVVAILADGKTVEPQRQVLTIKGNEITYALRKEIVDHYQIDPTKKPMHFDLIRPASGTDGEKVYPGIYKLEKVELTFLGWTFLEREELHICVDVGG